MPYFLDVTDKNRELTTEEREKLNHKVGFTNDYVFKYVFGSEDNVSKTILKTFLSCLLDVEVINITHKNVENISNVEQKGIRMDLLVDIVDCNKEKKSINFYVTGKYIGNDKIIDYPNIKLRVKCSYTYEDVNQEYTDMVVKDVLVTKKKDDYVGEDTVDIKRDVINSYSCFYEIVEVDGSYKSDK